MSGSVLRLLAMEEAERVGHALSVVHFAAFVRTGNGLSPAQVAIPLSIVALGNILGTIAGGRLADRLGDRLQVVTGAMAGSAVLALALYGERPGLVVTIAFDFSYVFGNSIARPPLMAALAVRWRRSAAPSSGLDVTSASFGWLGAAAVGGSVTAFVGFEGFGPLAAAIAGAATALLARRRRA